MIFKELLDICSVENVVKEIQGQFAQVAIDEQSLPQKVNQLMEEMRADENYLIMNDKLFCFMAVPKGDKENSLYVGLYDIDEKDISGGWENYKINQVRDWGFGKNSSLGVTVFEPSLKKYGTDCIVGGVLGALIFWI